MPPLFFLKPPNVYFAVHSGMCGSIFFLCLIISLSLRPSSRGAPFRPALSPLPAFPGSALLTTTSGVTIAGRPDSRSSGALTALSSLWPSLPGPVLTPYPAGILEAMGQLERSLMPKDSPGAGVVRPRYPPPLGVSDPQGARGPHFFAL